MLWLGAPCFFSGCPSFIVLKRHRRIKAVTRVPEAQARTGRKQQSRRRADFCNRAVEDDTRGALQVLWVSG